MTGAGCLERAEMLLRAACEGRRVCLRFSSATIRDSTGTGAGPGATCLLLALLLIPSPLPESHHQAATGTGERRPAGEGGHRQLPSGNNHSHQGLGHHTELKSWEHQSKVDLTCRGVLSLSFVSSANSSPKLSPPGFLACVSTDLTLQAQGAGPQGWEGWWFPISHQMAGVRAPLLD